MALRLWKRGPLLPAYSLAIFIALAYATDWLAVPVLLAAVAWQGTEVRWYARLLADSTLSGEEILRSTASLFWRILRLYLAFVLLSMPVLLLYVFRPADEVTTVLNAVWIVTYPLLLPATISLALSTPSVRMAAREAGSLVIARWPSSLLYLSLAAASFAMYFGKDLPAPLGALFVLASGTLALLGKGAMTRLYIRTQLWQPSVVGNGITGDSR